MRNFALIVMVALTSTTGCAAVFKGSKAEVHFDAVPAGADVRVDGRYLGATPTTGELSRNQAQNVLVSKDGFVDQHVQIQRHPDTPWWFWDIGTCVIPIMVCVPLLVDAISGAWMSIDDDIRVKLDPNPAPAATVPPSVVVPVPSPSAAPAGQIGL